MTYDKQALTALLAKIEAGDAPSVGCINRALMTDKVKSLGFPLRQLVQWIMDPDDIRGMDAVKALHEAVLPRCYVDEMGNNSKSMGWHILVVSESGNYVTAIGGDNPARAWLIAIIKALITTTE